MVMLVLAFVSGLIAANWITLQFDDRLIQLLSTGFDQAKGLSKKGLEMVWNRYQYKQVTQDVLAADFLEEACGNVEPYQIVPAQK